MIGWLRTIRCFKSVSISKSWICLLTVSNIKASKIATSTSTKHLRIEFLRCLFKGIRKTTGSSRRLLQRSSGSLSSISAWNSQGRSGDVSNLVMGLHGLHPGFVVNGTQKIGAHVKMCVFCSLFFWEAFTWCLGMYTRRNWLTFEVFGLATLVRLLTVMWFS